MSLHIIDDCRACQKHRVIKLKDWNALRDKAMTETLAAFKAAPHDEAKASDALLSTIDFRLDEAFLGLAPVVEARHPANIKLLALQAAGYSIFDRRDQAIRVMRQSLKLQDIPDTRATLAVYLLKDGQPDQARALVEPLLRDPEHVGLHYLVVESYQAQGRHGDALTVLDDLAAANPAVASDPEYMKYRQLAEKHAGGNKPIASANLATAPVRQRDSAGLHRLIGPAILLFILSIYLVAAYSKGRDRTFYIVNGLDTPYDLELNGQRVQVPARGHVKRNMPEGRIAYKSLTPAVQFEAQTIEYETNFWGRPFSKRTVIINPDQAALLVTQTTEYKQGGGGDSDEQLHANKPLHEFKGMDYEFTDFPKTISAKSGSRIKKSRVDQVRLENVRAHFGIVLHELGVPEAARYARNLALADPYSNDFVQLAGSMLPPAESIAMLKAKLAVRPVLIQWHRAYQAVSDRANPGLDLYAEYQALLKAEPENAALSYLLGRVAPTRQEARDLFQKAADAKPPVAYAVFALGGDALGRGDFKAAVDHLVRASRIQTDPGFKIYEIEARLGDGDASGALRLITERRRAHPQDEGLMIQQAVIAAAPTPPSDVTYLLKGFLDANQKEFQPAQLDEIRARFNATVAYARNDPAGFARHAESTADASLKAQAAISTGKLAAARQFLTQQPVPPYEHLALYIASIDAKDAALADASLASAIKGLRSGARDDRRLGEFLSAAKAPPPEQAIDLSLLPGDKRVVLVALAMKFPELKPALFPLAKTLNYDRQFPHLLIRKIAQ